MIPSIIQENKSLVKEIAIIWHIEDIQSIRPDLTDKQASIVLQRLKENHDANIGINWETIEVVSDILFPMNSITNQGEVSL
ncbi:MAG: hypothetical protein ACYCQI_16310 [Gammaproteobacteria bacterium]